MTITLGEALTADDPNAIDIGNPSINVGIEKAKKKAKRDRSKFRPKVLEGALKKAVMSGLDIALDEVIGQAWSTAKEIYKYADPEQTPADDVNVVPLSNHSIESSYQPSVDVLVRDLPVHTFDFDVAARLDIEGANLVIQGGMIHEIRLAKLRLGGAIKLHDRAMLEKDIAEVSVPAVMRLAKPIPIRPARA